MISNANLKKTFKLSSFVSAVVTITTVLFVVSGFYYKTTSADEEQSKEIIEVKKEVVKINEKINKADVFQGVSTAEYNALKDKVAGIERTVDKIDSKLDRILIQTK
jgi:predicted transcriptional regulator